jgi:hypothetical protein
MWKLQRFVTQLSMRGDDSEYLYTFFCYGARCEAVTYL